MVIKKNKKSKNKETIVPVFLDVPTREDLIKNNQRDMIELLDQYKKEYKKKLKEKLLLNYISCEDLSKKYLVNQDIIIRHIINNNYKSINEIIANGNTNELLNAKLEYLKLYILNEENNKIYKEILLRYIALTEIKNKSFFIKPSQKRAISNELNFLQNALIICKSNNFATNTDCKLYLIRMNGINNCIKNLSEEETKILNDKKRLVTKLVNTFIKEKHDNVLSSDMHDLAIVSYLEIELEKYYLSHRKELELLDKELDEFEGQKITLENKDELLKQIVLLELKYILVNVYNEIPKTTFEKLYKIKFSVLTNNINIFGEPVISKEDFGYEYYEKIVDEKINLLSRGDNQNFNYVLDRLSEKNNAINNYFYNYYEVLNNMEKLAVLLSFDKFNGFANLLNNTLVNKKDTYKIGFIDHRKHLVNIDHRVNYDVFNDNNSVGVQFSEYIPLKSVLEMVRRRGIVNLWKPLVKLYNCTNLIYPRNHVPEGIIKLVPSNEIACRDMWNILLPYAEQYYLLERNIVLPRTINELKDYSLYCYELPFGIEKITFPISTNQYIPPIPPTVNEIQLLTHERCNSLVLKFLDFKNSAFLKKRLNFINLINTLRLSGGIHITIHLIEKEKQTTAIEINDCGTSILVTENGAVRSYYNGCSKYKESLDEIYYKKIRRKLNHDSNNDKKEDKQKRLLKLYL